MRVAQKVCRSVFLSFWEVGRTVCGVTITRSNVSRMDPDRKMLSSERVPPSGQGRISQSLSSRAQAWSHLKTHWLGNKCTARTMNVPLFNSFLCCKMSVGTKAGVRILKTPKPPPPLTCCGPCAVCAGTCFTPAKTVRPVNGALNFNYLYLLNGSLKTLPSAS